MAPVDTCRSIPQWASLGGERQSKRFYMIKESALGISFLLAAVAPGSAQDVRCADDGYRAGLVDQLEKDFTELVGRIERVPPEEAAYLREEKAAALNDQNRGRFTMVVARPFYHASEVHEAFETLRQTFRHAKASNVKLSAMALYDARDKAAKLAAAFSNYIEFDEKRPQRVLPGTAIQGFHFQQGIATGMIGRTFRCVMSQWR